MRILRNKSKIYTVAFVLMFTIGAFMAGMPAASAHTPPWSIPTFAFISVSLNPVGKGQEVMIYMWLDKCPPTATGPWGDRWKGFKVEITKPDGTKETKGPFTSDPVGFAYTTYTPDQIGAYKLQFKFPGQNLTGENLPPPPYPGGPILGEGYIGDWFEPSESTIITLTVQEEPVPPYPETPPPTDYWTRPIEGELHGWSSIAGNWLKTLSTYTGARPFAYSKAPETAHILWTKPLTFGGLVGGEYGATSYFTGNAYEGKWWPPVIIGGILYYNQWPSSMAYSELMGMASYYKPGVHAVDLRTGEEIWYNPNIRIDFGQIYHYDSMNQHGCFAYLWQAEGPILTCYDAWTGQWLFNVTNNPGVGAGLFAAPWIYGPKGEILMPVLGPAPPPFAPANYTWLAMWNPMSLPELTGAWDIPGAALNGTAGGMWRPYNKVADGTKGYVWNITLSEPVTGSIVSTLSDYTPDRILVSTLSTMALTYTPLVNFTTWCFSIKSGEEGKLLWKKTYVASDFVVGGAINWGALSLEDKVFTLWCPQTRQHWGFSLENGAKIWGPTPSQAAWDFTFATHHAIAYGKLLSFGMGGILYAYNVKTGEPLWTYEVKVPYSTEAKWGGNYPACTMLIADKKIYLFTGEHSPDNPMERGSPLACVDLETGDELWSIPFYGSHWAANPAVADGIVVYMNAYDNQIYAFGKGLTAAEISASPEIIANGASVLIKGRVTDQSPGAKDTPAIADEYMDDWMKYLYMQFPAPMDVKGVDVILQARLSNGTIIDIGTVTCDGDGRFSYVWTPPEENVYTIMAVFAGSKSYWASYAETPLGVTAAPPAPAAAPAYTGIDLAIIAAVVVSIIIGIYSIYDHRKLRK